MRRIVMACAPIFLIICAGFLLGESSAYARVVDPTAAFDDTKVSECMDIHPLAGWGFKPGCKNTASRAGHRFDFRINREGIRGPDYPPRAPKGTKRIFLVGASIFFAPGLKETESSAAVLERKLREAGEKVEVLNIATEGYSSIQLFLRLKQWVAAYHPDIVLFNLSSQDIVVDQILAKMNLVTPASSPLPENIHYDPAHMLPSPVLTKLWRWPAIHKAVSACIYFYQRLKISWRYTLTANADARESEWAEISMEAMRRLQKMSEQEHFKLFIFLFPIPDATNSVTVNPTLNFRVGQLFDFFTPEVNFPITSIFQILGKNRLAYFMINSPEGPNFYLPGDYHFSEAGAKFVGEQLYSRRDLYLPAKKKTQKASNAPRQR